MVYGLASSFGYTIDYIMWEMTVPQIITLQAVAGEINNEMLSESEQTRTTQKENSNTKYIDLSGLLNGEQSKDDFLRELF